MLANPLAKLFHFVDQLFTRHLNQVFVHFDSPLQSPSKDDGGLQRHTRRALRPLVASSCEADANDVDIRTAGNRLATSD
jgi:hypothetical protein